MVSALDRYRTELIKARRLLRRKFQQLSKREQAIIFLALLMGIGTVFYTVYEPVARAFAAQETRLEDLSSEMDRVALAIARYAKLRTKRDEIERQNKEVEFSEGVLSYIEGLLRDKAGVTSGHQINPREPKPFGADYEQVPVSVRFPIVDMQRLVSFLEAVVHGEKPLILTSLDIKRRPAGDSLDVELEVTSLRRKSA